MKFFCRSLYVYKDIFAYISWFIRLILTFLPTIKTVKAFFITFIRSLSEVYLVKKLFFIV